MLSPLSTVHHFFLSHLSECSKSDVSSPSLSLSLCKPNILWGPGVLESKGSAEAGRERLHYPHQRARVNSHNQCCPITLPRLPLPLTLSLYNQINTPYWHEWKYYINIGIKNNKKRGLVDDLKCWEDTDFQTFWKLNGIHDVGENKTADPWK